MRRERLTADQETDRSYYTGHDLYLRRGRAASHGDLAGGHHDACLRRGQPGCRGARPGGPCRDLHLQHAGQLVALEDQNHRVTQYHYDVRGWLVRVIFPDGSEMAYEYDLAGRQTGITELNGTLTQQEYNALTTLHLESNCL